MNVLFVSNGEAEDAIAISLIRHWLRFREEDRVAGFAMVGTGKKYIANDIPLIARPMKLPSEGFAHLSWLRTYKDIESGLITYAMNYFKILNKLSPQVDFVIGVGDIVPVLAAKVLNKPNAFIGCAMSDYYLERGKSKPSSYSPLKRRFLKNMRSYIFPRDKLTTHNLQKLGLRAEYHGNPMMDCIEFNRSLDFNFSSRVRIIGILPGSRSDNRLNFRKIIEIIQQMQTRHPFAYLVAVSKKEDVPKYGKDLSNRGWYIKKTSPKYTIYKNNKDEVHLLHGYFGNILLSCHAVIGLSGTGNEQAVGIGVPTISFPGGEVQYNKKFAMSQKKLLGFALNLLPNPNPNPAMLLNAIDRALNDDKYREKVRELGINRFGDFGASERIVHRIVEIISPYFQ